jgi:hypothetical protein
MREFGKFRMIADTEAEARYQYGCPEQMLITHTTSRCLLLFWRKSIHSFLYNGGDVFVPFGHILDSIVTVRAP